MAKSKTWRGLATIMAILLICAMIMGNFAIANAALINSFLGISTSKSVGYDASAQYYRSDYGALSDESFSKLIADEYAFCQEEMEEGAVLLRNQNNALPLKADERKVTLFGHASAEPYYRAETGGPATTTGAAAPYVVTLRTAFESNGFEINTTLWDAYASSSSKRLVMENWMPVGKSGEEPAEFYTDALKATFADYNDAAIVVLAREAAENVDIMKVDPEGISQLALHQSERDMLDMIKASGQFKKVIVLLNSPNPMELEWLDEYDIDACLWVGGAGLRGFSGVPTLLTGAANPSGRLVDTYASNSYSAPAVENLGYFVYDNVAEVSAGCIDLDYATNNYMVFAENIYVGYKYYETRYEDVILNQGNAASSAGTFASRGGSWNYADEVVYPFGYGLSYTSFEQTLDKVTIDGRNITATVTVKNTGTVAGKDVTELYVQTPYTDYDRKNLVEKSAIQLIGFAKTDVLEPGQSQQLMITTDSYLFASYDAKGAKGYILDAGDYYIALGSDAHDALNNVLAAKGAEGLVDQNGNEVTGDAAKTYHWNQKSLDNTTFRYSDYTGIEVTNRFDDADLNYWVDGGVTYLSRQDWEGTYPMPVSVTATPEMIRQINGYTYVKPADAPDVSSFTQGKDAGLKMIDMKDVPKDDPKWDTFIDQLTLKDLVIPLDDSFGIAEVQTVAKPAQFNQDGPDGFKATYLYGDKRESTAYVNQMVAASSWNTDIMRRLGSFEGEDALYTGFTMLFAPGGDRHRTPFSGRNFEYYSEDSVLAYLLSIPQVQAMQEKGLSVTIKHFAGNDQETNRMDLATFMNEQTWREQCLRGFEGAFTKGGALSVMTSYNRLGCTYMGQQKEVLQGVLEGEWGFEGAIMSEGRTTQTFMHTIESIDAGTDIFCITVMDVGGIGYGGAVGNEVARQILDTNDGHLYEMLRDANKDYYYAMVRSNLINGLTHDTNIVNVIPWWLTLIQIIRIVSGATAALFTGLFVWRTIVENKRGKNAQ